MSGGSMEYLYRLVAQAEFVKNTPERRAFADHLRAVSNALRAIEWVDSGDYSPGNETEAIRAVLHPGVILARTVQEAHEAQEALSQQIKRCRGVE